MKFAPHDLERCCSNAPVRREWDTKEYVMNGYPSGQPIQIGEAKYFCAECGRRLSLSSTKQEKTP